MIDLGAAKARTIELIDDSIRTFSSENPDTSWSTFAVYSCPWVGWSLTCFDTARSSNDHVARWEKNGPDWYGEDSWGRYNDNCPDFEFFEWRRAEFPEWGSEYESGYPIVVRDLSGTDYQIDDSDEALNEVVFDFLRECLFESLAAGAIPKTAEDSDQKRRFGVQLLDSLCVQFWHESDIRC